MTELLAHVEKSIRSRKLLKRGQRVLVAVSGGLDSMVMLHVLHEIAAQQGWTLSVAHFNHQLRGRSSDADETLVCNTAKKLGLKYFADRASVKGIARQKKQSIEMVARELRHQFLARAAATAKCNCVALAHHADDQVELFFLRLLRGAGVDGLVGMKWKNPSAADKRVTLVRPMLDVSKAELARFACAHKIAFREDASNRCLDFTRNRVRNMLLPLLRREFQPALEKTILRVMEILSAETEFAAEALRMRSRSKRQLFSNLPVALQRRLLQQQLLELNIPADYALVESLRAAADKTISVGGDRLIARDAAGLITAREARQMDFAADQSLAHLKGRAGKLEFGGAQLQWHMSSKSGSQLPKSSIRGEVFDADRIGAQITLRHWRAGDRFQPIGMKNSVKLQDWFVNQNVPQKRRHELIVATNQLNEIFWVEGQRISENFKLTDQTKRRLLWRWRRG